MRRTQLGSVFTVWAFAVLGIAVVLIGNSGAEAGVAAPERQRDLGALGSWNGAVTLSTTQNDTSVAGNVTTGLEQLSFVVHGAHATEAGHAKWRHAYADACGSQVDAWYWSLGGASVPVVVTVDDSVIDFNVVKDASARYTFTVIGKRSRSEAEGGVGLCDAARVPQAPQVNGTGDPGFSVNVHSNRLYLLRSSGTFSATQGGQVRHAGGGSLGGGTTTVTWNLIRTGPDKDHDGLADPGDAHPNDPDSDGDGYPDGWEVDNGTSPTNSHSHPSKPWHVGAPDSDGDGWSDANEIGRGTDPHKASSHPSGLPDSPPVRPVPPGKPVEPPLEKHQNKWVKVPYTFTCEGGVILTQRCKGIFSPASTRALNSSVAGYSTPTVAQELAMCTRYHILPDVKQCASSNMWSFANQASFKLGLSIAAKHGACFFFDVSRRKIGDVWSGSWDHYYNQADYLMNPHEKRYFGSVNVACAEPDKNFISRFG